MSDDIEENIIDHIQQLSAKDMLRNGMLLHAVVYIRNYNLAKAVLDRAKKLLILSPIVHYSCKDASHQWDCKLPILAAMISHLDGKYVTKSDYKLIKLLLENGADPNYSTKYFSGSGTYYILRANILSWLINDQTDYGEYWEKVIELLVKYGTNVTESISWPYSTPIDYLLVKLHRDNKNKALKNMIVLLYSHGAKPHKEYECLFAQYIAPIMNKYKSYLSWCSKSSSHRLVPKQCPGNRSIRVCKRVGTGSLRSQLIDMIEKNKDLKSSSSTLPPLLMSTRTNTSAYTDFMDSKRR